MTETPTAIHHHYTIIDNEKRDRYYGWLCVGIFCAYVVFLYLLAGDKRPKLSLVKDSPGNHTSPSPLRKQTPPTKQGKDFVAGIDD